jgi:hypothetical protein
MVHVETWVVLAGIVAHPFIALYIDVRGVGMAVAIIIMSLCAGLGWGDGLFDRCWPFGGYVSTADLRLGFVFLLCDNWQRQEQGDCEQRNPFLHDSLR